MARRSTGQGRFSSRQKTWFWIVITTATVIALLYWEQIALLYVLATVSMTFLLLVVAFSDLSGAQTAAAAGPPALEPPAGEGTVKTPQPAPQSTFGARSRKRQR